MLELGLRLVFSLGAVVGLMLLLYRWTSRRMGAGVGKGIKIVMRQPVTRSSQLAVVEIGSRTLLVGLSEQRIELLTELDPEDLEATQPAAIEQPARKKPGRHAGTAPATESATESAHVVPSVPLERVVESAGTDADLESAFFAVLRGGVQSEARPEATTVANPVEPATIGADEEFCTDDFAELIPAARFAELQSLANQPTPLPEPAAAPKAKTSNRSRRRRVEAPQDSSSPLSGSVLSPTTWRQAYAALRRRSS